MPKKKATKTTKPIMPGDAEIIMQSALECVSQQVTFRVANQHGDRNFATQQEANRYAVMLALGKQIGGLLKTSTHPEDFGIYDVADAILDNPESFIRLVHAACDKLAHQRPASQPTVECNRPHWNGKT